MRWLFAVVWALGCSKGSTGEGLVGDGALNPFPSALHMHEGRVALGAFDLPFSEGGDPIPVERLAWRDGFSPAQTAVVRLPLVDRSGLPSWRAPTPGQGSVRLYDRTAAAWLPVFAEVDAFPGQDAPGLLIRPLVAMQRGHRIAVVITTEAAERPERFDALLRGSAPDDLLAYEDELLDMLVELDGAGLPTDQVALAWDFPVGEGRTPLLSALDQLEPPDAWRFDSVREADAGDSVVPTAWRVAQGTFDAQDFLVDDLWLDLQSDGSVRSEGQAMAELYVHIPTSVADAPAGTVPVLLFGHGLFNRPSGYLDEADDPSAVLRLADEGGFIVVASTWRGLTRADLAEAVSVANDFSRIPLLGDRLVQAQVNVRTLIEMVHSGALLDDPVFTGASGQSLPLRDRLVYYGISLGGIEGVVMMAQQPPIAAAVLHVGGGGWSTMLERSSDWAIFDDLMQGSVPDPWERQLLYSVSQLYWDPADPMLYTDSVVSPVLMQEAIGDDQVANLSSRALARSLGLSALEPAVDVPWGMGLALGGEEPGRSLYVQFDPQLPLPAEGNRPAKVTDAHYVPRVWLGTQAQTLGFLELGQEGTVRHHCGERPCAEDNQGSAED